MYTEMCRDKEIEMLMPDFSIGNAIVPHNIILSHFYFVGIWSPYS